MRRILQPLVWTGLLLAFGCGGSPSSARSPNARTALAAEAAWLEVESAATRQELFRDLAQGSLTEAGGAGGDPVLFPIVRDGGVVAAPGIDPRADLLQTSDAGVGAALSLGASADPWPEDARAALQGLSEREAAELVARALLSHWRLTPVGVVQVARAVGAPYAAAYVDGILRINPAFLYLAASSQTTNQ